jgi:predicted transcriptional regulator
MASTAITLTLDTERDRDILAYLTGLRARQRSEHIRRAIRQYITHEPTLAEVYETVQEIRAMLRSGAAAVPVQGDQASAEDDLQARARRKIADLGL